MTGSENPALCFMAFMQSAQTGPRCDFITDLTFSPSFLGYVIINMCYLIQRDIKGLEHLWIISQLVLYLSLQAHSVWCFLNQSLQRTKKKELKKKAGWIFKFNLKEMLESKFWMAFIVIWILSQFHAHTLFELALLLCLKPWWKENTVELTLRR